MIEGACMVAMARSRLAEVVMMVISFMTAIDVVCQSCNFYVSYLAKFAFTIQSRTIMLSFVPAVYLTCARHLVSGSNIQ
jgi:hypothetical protein